MKKKILKIVITFTAVIFLIAASVVPSFAVTNYRVSESFRENFYSGFSFSLIAPRTGGLGGVGYTSYFNTAHYMGWIGSGYTDLLPYADYTNSSYLENIDLNGGSADQTSNTYFGTYNYSDIPDSNINYAVFRSRESLELIAARSPMGTFYAAVDSFDIDNSVVTSNSMQEYFNTVYSGSGGYLAGLDLGDIRLSGTIEYSYVATSLIDGSRFEYTGIQSFSSSRYLPIINVDWLPAAVYSPPSEPEVGPTPGIADWSFYRIDDLYVTFVIDQNTTVLNSFDIFNTIIAYEGGNSDSSIYGSSFAEPLGLYMSRLLLNDGTSEEELLNAYNNGYDAGYNVGYASGFGEANPSFTTWLGNAISGLLSVPLFGWFGLGDLFLVVLSILLIILFVKLFAGG